jgi:hypothetical protein
MNILPCHSPLEWDTLIAYWLGELDPDSEAGTEQHYLGCPPCSRRLEQLASLAQGLRMLTEKSEVSMVVSEEFVRRLSNKGLRVREYRVPLNGSVNCTVTPEDDLVVAYLEAPLDDVQRVDLVFTDEDGKSQMRQEDIPFNASSGGVAVSTRIDTLRALPETTLYIRMLAVENNGERTLGEYCFKHTPYSPARPG